MEPNIEKSLAAQQEQLLPPTEKETERYDRWSNLDLKHQFNLLRLQKIIGNPNQESPKWRDAGKDKGPTYEFRRPMLDRFRSKAITSICFELLGTPAESFMQEIMQKTDSQSPLENKRK